MLAQMHSSIELSYVSTAALCIGSAKLSSVQRKLLYVLVLHYEVVLQYE